MLTAGMFVLWVTLAPPYGTGAPFVLHRWAPSEATHELCQLAAESLKAQGYEAECGEEL